MDSGHEKMNSTTLPEPAGGLAHAFAARLKDNLFCATITVSYAALIATGMFYHEMWRDELEIYSREAFTNTVLIPGDISFICYYAYLKLVMLINDAPATFQFAHLVIVVAAVFLFSKYARIPKLQRALLVFSYFLVYDYGIICRYYGFMILLVFSLVLLMTKKQPRYIPIAVLMVILANHSVQSAIFAASLSRYLLLDTWNRYLKGQLALNLAFKIASALFLAGWLAVFISDAVYTLKIASYMGKGNFGCAPIFINIKSIWNAFLPIPDPRAGASFLNTNIVRFNPLFPMEYDASALVNGPNILACAVSLIIVLVISIKFASKPMVLVTFLFNTVLYLVFMEYFLKVYWVRYQGLLFLIFVYTYFLYCNSEEQSELLILKNIGHLLGSAFGRLGLASSAAKPARKMPGNSRSARRATALPQSQPNRPERAPGASSIASKAFTSMLYVVLAAQIYAMIYAISMDIKYRFTYSLDAANYVKANNLDKTHVMVGYIDYATQGIAAYTRTKMFFPQINGFSYYQEPFLESRKASLTLSDIVRACTDFTEKQDRKVLLVLDFPLTGPSNQAVTSAMLSEKTGIRFLKDFSGPVIQPDEQFWLYVCEKVR